MKIKRTHLKMLIENLLNEAIPEIVDDPIEANKLAQYESSPLVKTLNYMIVSSLPVVGEILALKDFADAIKNGDSVDTAIAGVGVGLALIPFGGFAAKQIRLLRNANKLPKNVIVTKGGKEYLDAKVLLEAAVEDPKVKKLIADGYFVKTDIPQPVVAKPKVPGVTGRVSIAGTQIDAELKALKDMKNVLGDYAIGLKSGMSDEAFKLGLQGRNYKAIAMEKLPKGASVYDTIFKDPNLYTSLEKGMIRDDPSKLIIPDSLTADDVSSLQYQLRDLQKKLKANKDTFAHGDLHAGNIIVDKNTGKIKVYDPAGTYASQGVNAKKQLEIDHSIDMGRIEIMLNYLDEAAEELVFRSQMDTALRTTGTKVQMTRGIRSDN